MVLRVQMELTNLIQFYPPLHALLSKWTERSLLWCGSLLSSQSLNNLASLLISTLIHSIILSLNRPTLISPKRFILSLVSLGLILQHLL